MATVARLPLDVFATNDEAIVIAAVPGLQPEDLDVTINQNTLSLSGRVPSAAESEQGKGATWYLQELGQGLFQRTVTLPFEVDATQAQAVFDNGLVRITLPKAARAKPQKIAISRAESSRESIPVEATSS
jgi:HSP20 family protein